MKYVISYIITFTVSLIVLVSVILSLPLVHAYNSSIAVFLTVAVLFFGTNSISSYIASYICNYFNLEPIL